jgi:hypothetical protein
MIPLLICFHTLKKLGIKAMFGRLSKSDRRGSTAE